jgi:hypothetical protein
MSPKTKLPSVALHCPGFPKVGDFIALDCPQFGNKIGDSCPGLPSVAHPIGDRIGDDIYLHVRHTALQARLHTGFILVQNGTLVKPSSPGLGALTEPFADLSKGGSFRIGKAHTGRKVRSQDPILGNEVLILKQEFLIDQPGDVR